MLFALSEAGADFLVVGAHAMAAHGYPRATGDLDIWVRPTKGNADQVWRAIEQFGAPRRDVSPADFCTPDVVFQIGVEPCRIDILTSIDGVGFDEAWQNRREVKIDELVFCVIGREQLLKNKRATGRPKDRLDAEKLDPSDR
jgi:Nucleotidyl transferase of unknown function (DUF2204)